MPSDTDNEVIASKGCAKTAWLPLLTAVGLTLLVTAWPHLLTGADGKADHGAAMLLMWSISAGLVRGSGFIPRNCLVKALLGTVACFIALALALVKLNI